MIYACIAAVTHSVTVHSYETTLNMIIDTNKYIYMKQLLHTHI